MALKELTHSINIKKNNNCENAFPQNKITPRQIFLKDFAHLRNICFKNASERLLKIDLKQK